MAAPGIERHEFGVTPAGESVEAVVASYKTRFQQEAVLFATSDACLAFK